MLFQCNILNEKLEKLLLALNEESLASRQQSEKKAEKEDSSSTVSTPETIAPETEVPPSQPKKVSNIFFMIRFDDEMRMILIFVKEPFYIYTFTYLKFM